MSRSLLAGIALLLLSVARPLAAQATPPRWTLSADLRIGGDTQQREYQLGAFPRSIVPASDGSVYVVIDEAQEIRQYDAQGRHLRTIGRRGAGPGEFSRISGLGMLGDTLYVVDVETRRITYLKDGAVAGTTLLAVGPVHNPDAAYPMGLLAGDVAIGMGSYTVSARVPDSVQYVVRLTREGVITGDIATVSARNKALNARADRAGFSGMQPFSDQTQVAVIQSVGRVVLADGRAPGSTRDTTFGVRVVGITGRTEWSREYGYSPRPFPSELADSAAHRQFADMQVRMQSDMSSMASAFSAFTERTFRDAYYVPTLAPPVTGILVNDADGTVWLKREIGGPATEWTVIDFTRGDVRGTVSTRAGVTLLALNGDSAWGIERDSLDVPTLVRYRVSRP